MSAMYGNGNQLVNTWMPLILFFDMFACLFVRNFLPAAHLRRKIGARETLAAVAWTWTSFSLIFYAICEELKWPEA